MSCRALAEPRCPAVTAMPSRSGLRRPRWTAAANAELVRFVAERVGVPRGAVTIARGATTRRKTVAVEGVAADALARALLRADPQETRCERRDHQTIRPARRDAQ